MGSVRKLPSGNYQARTIVDGEKLAKTFRTSEEAHNWIDQNERTTTNTIAALKDAYLKEVMTLNGKKRGGHDAIFYKLDALDRLIGKSLEDITSLDVAAYKTTRGREVSSSSVRLELQLLSRFLRWASTEKGINCVDVVAGVKLPDAGKPRNKIIDELEYKMIVDQASERAKPIIMLAWETAMRRNELLAITPAMVDLRKKVIHLSDEQTKNGEGRDVPLSPKAIELLTQLCDGRDKQSPLFTLTPYAITQAFRRAARLSKVYSVCFHSLRHTCITRYAERGMNTIQLQCISGHKSIAMLARYSHIKASSVADLMG